MCKDELCWDGYSSHTFPQQCLTLAVYRVQPKDFQHW